MIIILLVIVGLSLLILGHEAGHFLAAKMFGLKVDEFGFGFPPRIFAKKIGDTEYSLNWLPFGGFVRISGERGEFEMIDPEGGELPPAPQTPTVPDPDAGRLFYNQPAWKKSIIVLAGVFTNFIFGWILISFVLAIGSPQALIIAGTEAGSPAAIAGIKAGDVVKGYTDSQTFINFVNEKKGTPITLNLMRTNKDLTLTLTPRATTTPNEGALGVELEQGGAARENPFTAIWQGIQIAGITSWLTLQAYYDLIKQLFVHASIPADVVGPVGIFGIAEGAGKIGFVYLLNVLAQISISLMIVNCIPFPALDGGRFFMVLIEKVRGKSLSYKTEAIVNGVGFAVLLLLMIVLTVRDIRGLI